MASCDPTVTSAARRTAEPHRSRCSHSLLLLNSAGSEKADAALALKMAEKAYAANPDDLATQKAVALAYAAKNQYAKAAEVQGKLVEKLKGPLKASEDKLLEEYKAKAAGK